MLHTIRQIRIILTIFMFLFSFYCVGFAEECPKKEESISWKYKISANERFRYEYKYNFDFNKSRRDNGSLLFNRFLVNFKTSLGYAKQNDLLELFVEGLDAQAGAYQIKPVKSQRDNLDLHQAYVNINDILDSDFSFKIGRQELKYGKGRLITASTWANRIRSFDAAVLKYHPEGLNCDILFASDVKYDENNFNNINHKEKLAGLYASYQGNEASALFEGYFLPQIIKGITIKSTRYTIGARAQGSILGAIKYDVEFPYQFGKLNNKHIKANALHVDLSHEFLKAIWRPALTFEYNDATGNNDPGNNVTNTFIPLYQSTHDPYGIMDFFRWQNMREVALNASLSLTKRLKLAPQTNFFWLMSTNDSWYDSNGNVLRAKTTGRRKHSVGQEVSLRAHYDFNKNIKFETGAAHFFTAKFVQESGANDDADWFYAQIFFTE